MTAHTGIGIIDLPNQRYRIVAKRGATLTLMLAGESGLGKTTFLNTLFLTTVKDHADDSVRHQSSIQKTVEIGVTKAELEENGFKVRLNVVDTPGFGDNVNNRNAWQPLVDFIDDQHESYMRQEEQPNRSQKVDMRVHACLYFIRPTGHSLKPLDVETLRQLSSRVNVIPIIAKADTLSKAEITTFKERINQVLSAQKIRVFQPNLDQDEINSQQSQLLKEILDSMPFSVIGSEKEVQNAEGKIVRGREYLWGVAEVENEDHCDFKKLRHLLIRGHMLDLIQTSEDIHYEAYRSQQLDARKTGRVKPRSLENPRYKEEEENLRRSFTEQVKSEERRFLQWEANLIRERDRLNKDLEETHTAIRAMEQEYEQTALRAKR